MTGGPLWSVEAQRQAGGLEFAVFRGSRRLMTYDFVEDALRYIRRKIQDGERVVLIESDGATSDVTKRCTTKRRGW